MEEVKNNINTFLSILQVGKSESVIHWDESNFNRAKQWAKYAEEVYKKLKNKPSFVQILSNYIKETQKLSKKDNAALTFTFNDLQYASKRLRLVLLHNPHLSSEQFPHILDMYQVDFSAPSDKDLENIVLDTYSINSSKGTFLILSSIKDQFSTKQSKARCNSVCTTENICWDTCAKLLWENIRSLTVQEENPPSDDCIVEKIKSVLSGEKGMEVVLRMLVLPLQDGTSTNASSDNGTVVEQIKTFIYQWILECSKSGGTKNYIKIWFCPLSLLCRVAAIYISFCESYMCFLHSCGDSLLGIGSGLVCSDDETSYKSSYQNIIQRIEMLLEEPGHVSELCKQKLLLWSQHSTEDMLNISYKIPLDNEVLRVNLWKRIYQKTCK